MSASSKIPWTVWLLFVIQLVLGIGACFGGGALVIDPTGGIIGMPSDIMVLNWFPNYLIPGLILLIVLGIGPLVIASALIRKWNWKLGSSLSPYKQQHWSWSFSLYSGFATLIWIVVEVYILQAIALVHLLYFAVGLAIQVITLLPPVIQHFQTPLQTHTDTQTNLSL